MIKKTKYYFVCIISLFLIFVSNFSSAQELAVRGVGSYFMRGIEFQTNVDFYLNKKWGATFGFNLGSYQDPYTTGYNLAAYKQMELGVLRRYKLGKSTIEPFYSVCAKIKPRKYTLDGREFENFGDYWLTGGLELEGGFELNITKKLATRYCVGVMVSNATVNTGVYYGAGFRYSFFYNEK